MAGTPFPVCRAQGMLFTHIVVLQTPLVANTQRIFPDGLTRQVAVPRPKLTASRLPGTDGGEFGG